jgi:photosystem II stability/assembly factor-like uncharacterized protein
MKKIILLSTFAFFLLPFSFSQQYGWIDISANVPGDPDLSDVFFVSDDEGWITSSSQAEIYHTTDGGATFEVQTNQFSTSLQAIYMINENKGYAGGATGFVYRTIDGGENWTFHGAISSTLTDIDFGSATQGYVCGDGGAVFSITPQGVSNLNTGQTIPFSGISSPSDNKVYVCGGGSIMFYSSEEWIFQSGPAGSYNDIFFLNDQKGWVVGDSGIFGHTEDGGENWTQQSNPDTNSLYGTFFSNQNMGWAIGAQGTILKTTNGGETWMVDEEGSTLAGTKFLRGIHFTSPTNGYVVGNQKTLLKYTEVSGISDGIETWLFEIFPNPAKDKCKVKSQKLKAENATIELFDLHGRKLLEKHITTGTEEVEVDVSNLTSGVYGCRLSTENKSVTKKIIIK